MNSQEIETKLGIDIERIINSGINLDPFAYDFVPGYPTLEFLSTKGFNKNNTDFLFEVDSPVGIYIHIPFCNYFCDYCYFVKHKYDNDTIEKYINSLIKELTLYSKYLTNKTLGFCYIGGGTPTSIPSHLLHKIVQFIYQNFKLADDFEFTCEASPNTLNKELISRLKTNGITRMSVGIQSFDATILKSMGRRYNQNKIQEITEHLHNYFPESFNYDFIFGYHLHSLNTINNDVDSVVSLNIPSATFYQIWLKRETCVKQKIKHLSYYDIFAQRELITNKLKESGYTNDKSDWFIKSPKAKYRFQDHKWKNGFFYGVGINSYGFANNIAYRNYLDIQTYLNHDFSDLPINNIYLLRAADLEKREVCLRIKLEDGINLNRISNPVLKSKLLELVELGLAKHKEDRVRLKPEGLSIAEFIAENLISN